MRNFLNFKKNFNEKNFKKIEIFKKYLILVFLKFNLKLF